MTAATPANTTADLTAAAASNGRLNGGCPSCALGPCASSRAGRVGTLRVVRHRCQSRLCNECGPLLGWILRQRLLAVSHFFPRPAMMTLTVDLNGTITGKGFDSPHAALLDVTGGKRIRELMKHLGIRHWFWVLEFQKNGNPHWHVLFNRADLPGGLVDYKRAWHFWRDTWKVGGVDVGSQRFSNPRHGIFYATKYLTKQPLGGYPQWVLELKRSPRFVGGCGELGPLVADIAGAPQPAGPVDTRRLVLEWLRENPGPHGTDAIASALGLPRMDVIPAAQLLADEGYAERSTAGGRITYAHVPRVPRRTLLDRVVDCGLSSDLFISTADPLTGEELWPWVGRIPTSPQDLHARSMAGVYPIRAGLPPLPGSLTCDIHTDVEGGKVRLVVQGASYLQVVTELATEVPNLLDLQAAARDEKRRRILDGWCSDIAVPIDVSAPSVPPLAQSHCPPEGNTPCETATSAPSSPPGRRSSSTSATAASPCRSDASSTAPRTPSPPPSSPPSP